MFPPARKFEVQGKSVLVFDNLFSKAEVNKIFRSLAQAKYTSYQIGSREDGKNYVFYNLFQARLSETDFLSTNLYRISRLLVYVYKPSRPSELTQVFCNVFRYGESVFAHTDHPRKRKGVISVLYCANDRWSPDWGGELYFFNAGGEACEVVGYYPGRFIVFDGSLSHRPGVPSRCCPRYRFALNIRYEW